MADELNGFDVSHLDGLAKLRAEQQSLRDLAARAAAHRDKVTEVYTRVVSDYEARVRGLDDRARELGAKVREEFAALDSLHEKARQAVDQARFEQQESEFRHEIGEYTREEFQRRQQAAEELIAARQQEFERIGALRARFLEIVPDAGAAAAPAPHATAVSPSPVPVLAHAAAPEAAPAVVTAPVPLPPPVAAISVADPLPATPVPAAAAGPAPAPTVVPKPAPAPAVPEAQPAAGGETSFMPPPTPADFQVLPIAGAAPPPIPGTAAPAAPGVDAERSEGFATVAIAVALLIEERHGLPGINHRLGLHTTIGRTPDNQIVVPVREVSRKHAEIVLTEAGYNLRDLGSPNGTFVNASRITEHRLSEGDRIAIGGQVFVFKAQ